MVGLVENGDGDVVELDVSLAHEVLKTAGAGDEDVGALLECTHLTTLRNTTEDGGGAETDGVRQRRDGRVHLGGQLTRGQQDQRTRT